jgi:hypothetical protein
MLVAHFLITPSTLRAAAARSSASIAWSQTAASVQQPARIHCVAIFLLTRVSAELLNLVRAQASRAVKPLLACPVFVSYKCSGCRPWGHDRSSKQTNLRVRAKGSAVMDKGCERTPLTRAHDWNRLTPEGRIRRCRSIAAEARQLSESAPTDTVSDNYLDLEDQWLLLAEELQRQLGACGRVDPFPTAALAS